MVAANRHWVSIRHGRRRGTRECDGERFSTESTEERRRAQRGAPAITAEAHRTQRKATSRAKPTRLLPGSMKLNRPVQIQIQMQIQLQRVGGTPALRKTSARNAHFFACAAPDCFCYRERRKFSSSCFWLALRLLNWLITRLASEPWLAWA
jgi:hypothetical protein